MLNGIDISRWQGKVDFDAVLEADYAFVVVKASEGQSGADPRFQRSWSALVERSETLVRGAYHFARLDTDGGTPADAEREALAFCSRLALVGHYGAGALPPALDIEWGGTNDQGPEANIAWVARWIEVVEQTLGRSPMIYTGPGIWRDRFDDSARFSHLPLWIADYQRSAQQPAAMPWTDWTFWQWSGGGRFAYGPKVPGISPDPGVVDLDRFAGTPAQLRALSEPRIIPPASSGPPTTVTPGTPRSLMTHLDLRVLDSTGRSPTVAQIQGLLMAAGIGPEGLVNEAGLPDGLAGPFTRAAVEQFRRSVGLSAVAVVDGQTWWELLTNRKRSSHL